MYTEGAVAMHSELLDELVWDCHPDIAQDVADLGVRSIRKAGEYLKLRVPLDGEAKIGNSWQAIH